MKLICNEVSWFAFSGIKNPFVSCIVYGSLIIGNYFNNVSNTPFWGQYSLSCIVSFLYSISPLFFLFDKSLCSFFYSICHLSHLQLSSGLVWYILACLASSRAATLLPLYSFFSHFFQPPFTLVLSALPFFLQWSLFKSPLSSLYIPSPLLKSFHCPFTSLPSLPLSLIWCIHWAVSQSVRSAVAFRCLLNN